MGKQTKRQSRALARRLLGMVQTFRKDSERLFTLHERRVRGLQAQVLIPSSSGNGGNGGNGGGYSDDFLSYFQVEGVDLLYQEKRILIADEMGVGKTAQGIAGKLEIENRTKRRCPTLVICPRD